MQVNAVPPWSTGIPDLVAGHVFWVRYFNCSGRKKKKGTKNTSPFAFFCTVSLLKDRNLPSAFLQHLSNLTSKISFSFLQGKMLYGVKISSDPARVWCFIWSVRQTFSSLNPETHDHGLPTLEPYKPRVTVCHSQCTKAVAQASCGINLILQD